MTTPGPSETTPRAPLSGFTAPGGTALGCMALGCAIGCGGRGVDDGDADRGLESRSVALGEAQFERARIDEPAAAELPDETGGAWRVIEVPSLGSSRGLVDSPLGWLAVSWRQLGDGRAPSGSQSVLYRSTDGVRWQAVPVTDAHDDLLWKGVAHGNGTYVVAGGRGTFGNDAAVWTSPDGSSWTEHPLSVDSTNRWQQLAFAGERFFAFGTFGFAVSRDGASWAYEGRSTLQPAAVAHGAGRYVVVGTGPAQVSVDGDQWQEHAVDCEALGDCIVDPDGVSHGTRLTNVLFAEGRFHARERVSDDGVSWEAAPGRDPLAYVKDRFVEGGRSSLTAYRADGEREELRVVRPAMAAVQQDGRRRIGWLGRDGSIPEVVEVPFEDGLTCATATCLVIGSRLLLVPPDGTPPLVDRVPRATDGQPLLSDDCPVSSQIFCSDYAARSDCRCDPEAPRSPESCADVSQYQCEGAFAPVGDEWHVDEVAEGGCSCTGVDPAQPPTFGEDCNSDQSQCQAPLECLSVDSPPSAGPTPQRSVCTAPCSEDADCPSWQATGFCSGPVRLRCSNGSCQPRDCG